MESSRQAELVALGVILPSVLAGLQTLFWLGLPAKIELLAIVSTLLEQKTSLLILTIKLV